MEIVAKGWGYEKHIVNNPKYCGKILHFFKGKRCSFHYHKLKEETFLCHAGEIEVKFGWEDDLADAKSIILKEGDTFHVPIGLRHQMIAIAETDLFEFSTTDFPDDSYRVAPGDSQK